jgi:hypothetical protein
VCEVVFRSLEVETTESSNLNPSLFTKNKGLISSWLNAAASRPKQAPVSIFEAKNCLRPARIYSIFVSAEISSLPSASYTHDDIDYSSILHVFDDE